MQYDVIVIGDGPAALSAAINLKIRNQNILLMGNQKGSGKVQVSHLIDNYLGLPNVTGPQLIEAFVGHAQKLGVEWANIKANQVFSMGNSFTVSDKNGGQHTAKAVIIAAGVSNGNLIEGEETFLGRGVSYCATCDGNFYKGKTVVVIGQNEEAIHEANFLADLAAKTYFIPLKKLEGTLSTKIEKIMKGIKAIKGDKKVSHLLLTDGELPCDGVFVLRDAVSPSYLAPGVVEEAGHIKVDVSMQTNIKGLYACGDCVGKPYQLNKAVGQGQTAALNAVQYLAEQQ